MSFNFSYFSGSLKEEKAQMFEKVKQIQNFAVYPKGNQFWDSMDSWNAKKSMAEVERSKSNPDGISGTATKKWFWVIQKKPILFS